MGGERGVSSQQLATWAAPESKAGTISPAALLGWGGLKQARGARELIPSLLSFLRCPLTPNRVNQNKTRAVLPTSSVNPFPKLASTSVHLICPNPQSDTLIPALELDLHTQSLWENARTSLILLLLSLPPGLYCLSICSPPAVSTYVLCMLGPLTNESLLEFPADFQSLITWWRIPAQTASG